MTCIIEMGLQELRRSATTGKSEKTKPETYRQKLKMDVKPPKEWKFGTEAEKRSPAELIDEIKKIAIKRYTWKIIRSEYFSLIGNANV